MHKWRYVFYALHWLASLDGLLGGLNSPASTLPPQLFVAGTALALGLTRCEWLECEVDGYFTSDWGEVREGVDLCGRDITR